MNFELEEHEARYLAYSLAVHISRFKQHVETTRDWADESGSLDGDYGAEIKRTDEGYIEAMENVLSANRAIFEKFVAQLPQAEEPES